MARRQDRVDAGHEPGLTSPEKAELAAARRRIVELETELAIHQRASELLKEGCVRCDIRRSAMLSHSRLSGAVSVEVA